MFYILLFLILFISIIIMFHDMDHLFPVVGASATISSVLSFIIAIFILGIVNTMSDTKPILINNQPIIQQKYKQKEEYYIVYKSKNDGFEKYYYAISKNGIYMLDSKPVDQTKIVYSKDSRVETYIDRYTNPNIKFWFWSENKTGERYIIYINDRNFNLK